MSVAAADDSFVHIDAGVEQQMLSDDNDEYSNTDFTSTSLQLKASAEKSLNLDDATASKDDEGGGDEDPVQIEAAEVNQENEPEPTHQYESLGIEGVDDVIDGNRPASGLQGFIGSKLMNFKTRFSSVSSNSKFAYFITIYDAAIMKNLVKNLKYYQFVRKFDW